MVRLHRLIWRNYIRRFTLNSFIKKFVSMFRISICDDNMDYISSFEKVLAEKIESYSFLHSSLYEIGPCFNSGEEVLEYLGKHIIDVLFLDIRMPDMSGFDLAKVIIRDYKDVLIVFATAYDEYVYEAFDYSPFAFLRKNHIDEDLPKILKRLDDKLTASKRTIRLSAFSKDLAIDVREILYFESKRNYYIAHTKDGCEYVRRGTISNLEKDLGEYDFFRTHSGFLVNLNYAEKIIEERYLAIGDNIIPIALKRLPNFKRTFERYKMIQEERQKTFYPKL